jgi:hypothetical protein
MLVIELLALVFLIAELAGPVFARKMPLRYPPKFYDED